MQSIEFILKKYETRLPSLFYISSQKLVALKHPEDTYLFHKKYYYLKRKKIYRKGGSK